MRIAVGLLLLGIGVGATGCKGCDEGAGEEKPAVVSDPPAPHDVGSWLSMKADSKGNPVVAYYDRTSDALGFAVGKISGSGVTWVTEEVDSYPDENGLNPGDAGRYTSMAFDNEGVPWIVYQDTTNGTLKYARKDDGGWSMAIADSGGGAKSDAGYWASMTLDKDGNPVAVHYDKGRGDLRIARWSGDKFQGAIVDEGTDYDPADSGLETIPANTGEYAKITVGDDGKEYIAYYDRAWGALRLAVGNGTSFNIVTVDDDGDVGQWPDIAVAGGKVYIAYQDVTLGHLKLAVGSGSSFDVEVVDASAYTGADTALWVDGSSPGILYFDGVNNDQKLARKDGAAWKIETVTGSESARGYHNESIEVDGKRFSACYDYTTREIWFAALP